MTLSTNWYHLRVTCSLLFFFIGVIFGFTTYYTISFSALLIGVLLLFFNYGAYFLKHLYRHMRSTITVKSITTDSVSGMLFSKLMKKSLFQKLDSTIRDTVMSSSIRVGYLQNPLKTSRKTIVVFACSTPLCVVLAVTGAVFFEQMISLLLLIIPLLVLLSPRISNSLDSADFSAGYDNDLGYFLSYLHISHMGKVTLYDAMIRLIDTSIFPTIQRDAKILQRWVDFDGLPKITAINKLANVHANSTFQKFLFAYFDISNSNHAGLDAFIEKNASKEFEKTIISDEKAIDKISTLFLFGGLMMIMVPALLVMMSFLVSGADKVEMISFANFLTPLAFAMIAILMYHNVSDSKLFFSKRAVLGLFLVIPCYVMTSDFLTSLSLGIATACIINGLYVSKQISSARSTVDGFVPFIRDLIERRKVDSNFVVSLKNIFRYDTEKKYGEFSYVLDDINNGMNVFSDKKHDTFSSKYVNSKRLKMMLFVLQSIYDGGHRSTISSLERLHSFSDRTIQIKNRVDDALKLSSLLILFAPVIFFVVLSGLSTVMLSFSSNMPALPDNLAINADVGFFQPIDMSSILSAMKPMVFLMSLCSGIVISRVTYSSFAATLPMGICMMISFVLLAGWDFFFGMIVMAVETF